jgi:hypothetical protein
MEEKKIASKVLLVSVMATIILYFLVVYLDDWMTSVRIYITGFEDNWQHYSYSTMITSILFIPITYAVCSLMLFAVNNNISKKWLEFSLRWTVPSGLLSLIFAYLEMTSGSGFRDFGIYLLFYEIIWSPLVILTLYTPFYLYGKHKRGDK